MNVIFSLNYYKKVGHAMNVHSTMPSVSWEYPAPMDKALMKQFFIMNFCEEVNQHLLAKYHYVNFTNTQLHAREVFLDRLKENSAVIKDKGDLCRAVCAPIQAAFETILANKLKSGSITKKEFKCKTILRHNKNVRRYGLQPQVATKKPILVPLKCFYCLMNI